MKVRLIEMDPVWESPSENIKKADCMIRLGEPADLYVLPEMWATGFVVKPFGVAEEEKDSEALSWMKQTAKSLNCAICGSLAVRSADNHYCNRHFFVTPNNVIFYDKRHLFSHGGEKEYYTCGERPVIAEWQGFRFLLQTCYDLRFPVFSRYGRAGEYDAIIYVANWPASRMLAWQVLTRARAIENQCYVIAVNRIGCDPQTTYEGGSCVIDPKGQIISLSTESDEAELSKERLLYLRNRFNVLADRD